MAPKCFGPLGPSLGSIRRDLAKVTVFVEIINKNKSLKLLLCSGNICFSLYTVCVLGTVRRVSLVIITQFIVIVYMVVLYMWLYIRSYVLCASL